MRGKRHTGERGQAFEAYRVLIAAVIAIAVLVIIVSTISYFDRLKEEVSTDTLNASWKSAVDAPNGKVIRAQDLSFNQGTTFSRRAFAKQVNLVDTCLVFDAEKAARGTSLGACTSNATRTPPSWPCPSYRRVRSATRTVCSPSGSSSGRTPKARTPNLFIPAKVCGWKRGV